MPPPVIFLGALACGLVFQTVWPLPPWRHSWVLVALVPVLRLVHYGVSAREERYVERRFGEEYRQFCRRVRRWLDAMIRIWRFLTLVLAALTLSLTPVYVLEIPQKLNYDAQLYSAVNTTM